MGIDLELRRRSAATFGAERFAEVVLGYQEELPGAVPLKALVERTGFERNLLNPILFRLCESGALRQLPRLGGSRGPVAYDIANQALWNALLTVAAQLRSPLDDPAAALLPNAFTAE